jgi:uncharacterized membrane protein
MSLAFTVFAGLIVGFATGRWWALWLAALIVLWFGFQEQTPLSPWFFGLVHGGVAAAAIVAGVLVRRRSGRHDR